MFRPSVDTVNTAARIAWKAHKQGRSSLCTEGFRDSCFRSRFPAWVRMDPAGSVALKGKTGEIPIYQPVRLQGLSTMRSELQEVLLGRDKEISEVKNVIERRCCWAAKDECSMVVIQGASGSGKSALLRHVAQLASSLLPDKTTTVIQLTPAGQEQSLSTCSTLVRAMLDHVGVSRTGQDWVLEVGSFPSSVGQALQCLQFLLSSTMSSSEGVGPNPVRRLWVNRSMHVPLLLQSGQGTSEIDLPDMLRPFAPELADAQAASPSLKIKKFSELYIQVLLRLMGEIQQPVVVVIDDADLLDGASMGVLVSLGMQLGLSAGSGAPAMPCAIIMACKSIPSIPDKPLEKLGTEESHGPGDLSLQPGIAKLISLSPLDKDSISTLAKMLLCCKAVSVGLVNFIYSAVPLPPSSIFSSSTISTTASTSSPSTCYTLHHTRLERSSHELYAPKTSVYWVFLLLEINLEDFCIDLCQVTAVGVG